ncbi:hypothetical protein OG339_48295 (plasmid) [Streptosporangium sp. NBC_01495]|uniref:hypothetical protein n=1 Tax=Streptosporangium sp. NBC_01495 TaxID=2903899 RepID=UPI002E32B216|nr:hypothetical protein [Streptosporangium sp. NBC_01495]
MNFVVDPEVDQLARRVARERRIPVAEYYRALVREDPVDKHGRPHWKATIPVASGGPNAVFQVNAEIYSKASTAAGFLGISVAEYYRQLVRRDHEARQNSRPGATSGHRELSDLHHGEAAA